MGATVLLALLAVVVLVFARTRSSVIVEDHVAVSSTVDADGEFDLLANGELELLRASRPNYRYSVVPGGAYDEFELRSAVQRDPVVAAHYEQLDQSKLRVETVARDRYVHVSYRKGNEIFWTKNKVLLRQGETILTDGKTQVRARCGNCISEQPQLPTATDEPETVEFDRLTDPPARLSEARSGETALVPTAPVATPSSGQTVGAAAPAAGSPDPLAAGRSSTGGAALPLAAGRPGGDNSPTPSPGAPGEATPTPGAGDNPAPNPLPGFDVLPPFTGVPGFPEVKDPLTGDELFPDTPGSPAIPPGIDIPMPPPGSPGEPANPVPVPEPGTLFLVGGGVAALIRKLRSRAS